MNGLKIEWEIGRIPASATTLVQFLVTFTSKPALFTSHHRNSNEGIQADMNGYSVDRTGFKADFWSDTGFDWFAIRY